MPSPAAERPTGLPAVARARGHATALGRLAVLAVLVPPALGLLVTTLIGFVLWFCLGVFPLFPAVTGLTRAAAGLARRLAGAWSGVPVPSPYLPRPERERPAPLRRTTAGEHQRSGRPTGDTRTVRWLWTDPATWRDYLWVLLNPLIGGATAAVPLLLVGCGLAGLAQPALHTAFLPLDGADTALLGFALAAAGLGLAERVLRLHGRWTRALLGPTEQAAPTFLLGPTERAAPTSLLGPTEQAAPTSLLGPTEQAAPTSLLGPTERAAPTGRGGPPVGGRPDLGETRAPELRRIERDLHDGAQARLVAVGLRLGAVGALIDRDPQAAKELVSETQANVVRALQELRDLVRGIHPPVLAERGLVAAVRALALDVPLKVEVRADVPGRAEAPVESAVYFAVSEALANAVKHGGARRASVEFSHAAGRLRAEVADDGHGGADPRLGSGLRGIQCRLAAFDGTLTLSSPPGGPTRLTMDLPCALSALSAPGAATSGGAGRPCR
ncbi:sensor histidine kinase [Kitasatospora sp. NBC_01246]|uniref:sensor histidine kinase n=1 Tax=Kitasatospora sp. NBC_01246 TaxID=2903570 RepID=UPI002E3210BF|nr:sensor histidine kinase [Kitasatospora sp. NBC_01246]